jgi:hypothetical protein
MQIKRFPYSLKCSEAFKVRSILDKASRAAAFWVAFVDGLSCMHYSKSIRFVHSRGFSLEGCQVIAHGFTAC